jgi:succinoglycan biosynthesis transport protein ExoP
MQPHDANQPSEGRPAGAPPAVKGRQGPNQPPAILNNAPTPASLFRCLQRRLVLAVFLGLILGGVAAGGAWLFAPEAKHTVRAVILVPARHELAGVRGLDGAGVGLDLGSHQKNQMALVRSRGVLGKALADSAVARLPLVQEKGLDAVQWLEREVHVDFTLAPELMKISMQGLDTKALEVIVNAISVAYKSEVEAGEAERRSGTKKAVEALIPHFDGRLKELQVKHTGFVVPKDEATRVLHMNWRRSLLAVTQGEHLRATSNLKRARQELATLEKQEKERKETGKPPEVPESAILAGVERNPDVVALRGAVAALKDTLDYNRGRAQQKNGPVVTRNKSDLAKAEGRLAKAESDARKSVTEALQKTLLANSQSAKAFLLQEEAKYARMEAELKGDVGRQIDEVVKESKQGDEIDQDKVRIGHVEQALARLKSEQETLQIREMAGTGMSVREPATVIEVDTTARRAMIAGGAGLGMFAFCLLGLAYLEYRTRKVATVEDVVLGLGMRLVGTVPNSRRAAKATPSANGKKVPTLSQQVLTESIDAARTTLLHLARSHSLRTVMVTSAIAGEGKTSLSCHLAASLARAGLRVLLIDADMRNPSAHRLFGMKGETGFSEVLCGQLAVQDCLKETSLRNLTLLPAGGWSDETAAALNQGQAAALFEQLRQQFDIIVIDSSPVLPVADALLIGQQVDGVVLSVLCEVSRLNNLYAAWQRVQEHGGQPLGVVINGVSAGAYGSAYYYPYPRKKVKA